jgi:hypothetical protein
MKKLFVLTAATFFLAVTMNAQNPSVVKNNIKKDKMMEKTAKTEKKEERKALRKLEGNQVSYQSKQAFINDFGNIPVTSWARTDYFDEATFTKDGKVMKAYYDGTSNLVGTTSHSTFDQLPGAAQKYINAKYAGYTKGDVIFFDDNELNETDMVMYGEQFDDADNYFIDLKKDGKEIMLRSDMSGNVTFFKQIK